MADRAELKHLDFGRPGLVDGSLSASIRRLEGSRILQIAGEIREHIAAGHPVCNLTVGDFDAKHFPIPGPYREGIQRALDAGHTGYPPSDGVLELRRAITEHVARTWEIQYPVESVLVSSGARPTIYAAFLAVLSPGEKVVHTSPSWNTHYYVTLSEASAAPIRTRPENAFMPTMDDLAPHLGDARLICLCTPSNPTGTVMSAEAVREIASAVVEENRRRTRAGKPHLFLLMDLVYSALVFGRHRHVHPVAVVPEAAPWIISVDGVSKAFAATGLRVGWSLAAPELTSRIKRLIGHVGAWAPKAEQVALAEFLRDTVAVDSFRRTMNDAAYTRLSALYRGFTDLREAGYPVECIEPQGAVFLSLRLNWIGRKLDGATLETNESIRQTLLHHAGIAVVPFQAFGVDEENGWFRMSVGAVSMEQIAEAFPRVRALMDRLD